MGIPWKEDAKARGEETITFYKPYGYVYTTSTSYRLSPKNILINFDFVTNTTQHLISLLSVGFHGWS